jgi:hypothetical protein
VGGAFFLCDGGRLRKANQVFAVLCRPVRQARLALGALVRAVPSFELAISQAIYHSKWLLGRFLGLMKGIEGQATETAA